MSLSGKEKFSYGLGAVGKDMVYMLSASYILYYYQDILGVNAVAMGIIRSGNFVITVPDRRGNKDTVSGYGLISGENQRERIRVTL